MTYEDADPYKNLLDWLKDGKAEISKVSIEVKSEGHRTLRANQFIKVLFVVYCISKENGSSLFRRLITCHWMR